MNNLQGIFGLFIVLAITLTMGLQFANFTPFRISNAQWQQLPSLIYAPFRGVLIEKRCKEGFDNKGSKDKEDKQDLPIHTKKSGSMAKQSVFDDMMPSY